MRLDNEPKSKSFLDLSWVPFLLDRMYLTGEKHKSLAGREGSYVNNPMADMNLDEQSMAKSGATYDQLLFLRALKEQNEKGFSPFPYKRGIK